MKITTWNVNSIRVRQERLFAYLQKSSPDVVCLQELKCLEDKFPALELKALGYESAVHGQKTYNGVAILSKTPITEVMRGLPDTEDPQSRVIAGTVRGVRIFSVYAPNGQAVDSPAYQYKLDWYARLRRFLDKNLKPSDPVVVTGDFNVAPEDIDVHDPKLWEGQTLFSLPERAALKELMGFGLQDVFRQRHPGEEKRFSWWDYRMLGFQKNKGLRIDHVLASSPLGEKCRGSDIDREERKGEGASDHAPVWADFDV